jgi:phosphorylase kinase alpha/beta subunit
MPPIVVQNEKLLPHMTDRYDSARLRELRRFLERHGTFKFTPLRTGLFPAAVVTRSTRQSGYQHVWVRDNIHVSHALYINGNVRAAAQTMSAVMQFFARHRHRFEDVIDGKVKRTDSMSRPHVRFNGETLQESPEIWAHAQNDALGCFLWMYCTLASENIVTPSRNDIEMLTFFPLYFDAIRYWEDEDSGHWEETRKIEASSIGAVVAGLAKLRAFLSEGRTGVTLSGRSAQVSDSFMKALERRGRNGLHSMLPHECVQTSSAKKRRYDGALLFLVYPFEVVGDAMGSRILRDIAENLEGPYGIKRYVGDSYWAADYKDKLDPAKRTADFSHGVGMRNKLLAPGQEAQWCLFDPIMSAAYGRRYHRTGRKEYLKQQTHYFNRSLGQLTGQAKGVHEFQCPEAYYLQRGRYVPNDQTPLLWTQANLLVAIKLMEQSLSG